MQTEAIFENIAERIEQEISKAQKSIFIAVAWFTNKNLFNELLKKARNGCSVYILISDDSINKNCQIEFNRLAINHSRVYWVGNGDSELMHNKFCVIDYNIVITGSYNWSYRAQSNFENVIITTNDTILAEQFISEFNHIRKLYYPNEPKDENIFPISKIIKRLEILKNYILLEDIEELSKETAKLLEYNFNNDLDEIIEYVRKEEFAAAIIKIQEFISKNQQLAIWNDLEIAALKFEIKNLENQLNAFDNEKIELEKVLIEFQHRHTSELGAIILEILQLRKIKFISDKAKFDEAEDDERQYKQQVDEEKEREIYELTEEEKIILKKTFRKATVLCHPDKVSDEMKEAAQSVFIELKDAYDANDLKKVSNILNDLERGNYFKYKSETVLEADLLKIAIAKLRKQIKTLETEILIIKQSETFKTITNIEDWDEYFRITKAKLKNELEELKIEVEV